MRVNGLCSSMFCGMSILCCKSVVHLGHNLAVNLKGDDDIYRYYIQRDVHIATCIL